MADDTPTPDTTSTTDDEGVEDAPDASGDAEKWKALSRKNERELRKAQKELEDLRQATMSDAERLVAQARAEGRAEAIKTTLERLLRSEVRSVAAGLLADPDDAALLLDLSRYEPDDSMEFDRSRIKSDIEALVKAKPYLAAGPGPGSGEGGPRGAGRDHLALNGDPLLRDLKAKLGL